MILYDLIILIIINYSIILFILGRLGEGLIIADAIWILGSRFLSINVADDIRVCMNSDAPLRIVIIGD